VTVTIYVEGASSGSRCREGFAEYCAKVAPEGCRFRIVACGGRNQAFDDFRTAIRSGQRCALLVDSERAVEPGVSSEDHLLRWDRQTFPNDSQRDVFLMVQAMEAWFFADREAVAAYYGQGFRPNALRGDERNVEIILKDDLVPSLISATTGTKTKGAYQKVRHGFDLLAMISPEKVEAGSGFAADFNNFLRSA
jgi:hypothetical protein